MQESFWAQLKKPIMALAPMANVTDAAFRRIIAQCGKPGAMFTEFVSCDGLLSRGKEKLLVDLWYSEIERPIVAQIFGSNPEHFYRTALLIAELGFDGIDINMGCPDRNVEKQGGGAALMKNPELAKACIRETQRGAGGLPVSVKTRLGYSRIEIETWIPALLDTGLAAITIHGRTRKEMSKVPAHWDMIGRAAAIRNTFDSSNERTLILGNGDVETVIDACAKCDAFGVDGVMIGRGVFGNPWLFTDSSSGAPSGVSLFAPENGAKRMTPSDAHSISTRLSVMLEHTQLFEALFTGIKSFDIMKKHYKAYVTGFDGAKELRVRLMECSRYAEVVRIVREAYPDVSLPEG